MTITSRTAALCLLAAAGCQSARAVPAPPPERDPSERFERDMLVRFHMHQSYDLVRAIEKLLVRGNLDDARAFARAIAEAPDEPGLGAWARHAAVVRERAAALAVSHSNPPRLSRRSRYARCLREIPFTCPERDVNESDEHGNFDQRANYRCQRFPRSNTERCNCNSNRKLEVVAGRSEAE
jgi:hypothetical protein